MAVFCSDIDGTLLNAERTLSPRTVAAVRSLIAAGHTFVLCSSRMPTSMRLLEALYEGGDVPLIAYNGGIVLRSDASVALNVPIRPTDAGAIYETCQRLDLHGSFYSGEDWYAWAEDKWTAREANNTGVHPNDEFASEYYDSGRIKSAPPHKVMCMGEANLIDIVEQQLAHVPEVVTYRSKDTYLEIANAECSKGAGLASVAQELGVDLADCYFFGDNYNDLPAFAVVGTSIAVSNAKDAVLAAATVVTSRHHDDGVAEYLENFLATS
ncbi:Cof-type HAD-IIB family hydrolase [Conyzicola sp.]|uniref:Cof-type HAD-IIB family hydrolase n=1 Tax=Conyzicola sp. TaxID=1969404 RepID=UPI003988D45D